MMKMSFFMAWEIGKSIGERFSFSSEHSHHDFHVRQWKSYQSMNFYDFIAVKFMASFFFCCCVCSLGIDRQHFVNCVILTSNYAMSRVWKISTFTWNQPKCIFYSLINLFKFQSIQPKCFPFYWLVIFHFDCRMILLFV